MSRRIEIEITSLNGEVATWRAAGAKLPKGVLNASLIAGGPVVGLMNIDELIPSGRSEPATRILFIRRSSFHRPYAVPSYIARTLGAGTRTVETIGTLFTYEMRKVAGIVAKQADLSA